MGEEERAVGAEGKSAKHQARCRMGLYDAAKWPAEDSAAVDTLTSPDGFIIPWVQNTLILHKHVSSQLWIPTMQPVNREQLTTRVSAGVRAYGVYSSITHYLCHP
jgi:hypothetical protein